MAWLTAEQALADYAELLRWYKYVPIFGFHPPLRD
jgi:hypothetical protein